MKKLFSAIIIAVLVSSVPAHSQIGGLINKAKNETQKPKSENSSTTTESKDAKSNTATNSKVVKEEVSTSKFSAIKAGMVNASFEEQAVKLVTEKATNEGWAEKYTKAKIISTDWEIEKDQYTEKIIYRKIYMKLYGVWPDGKCKAVEFGFKQDYMGGDKYTKSLIYNSIGDMNLIDCD